jgi:hypothetical protein
MTMGSTGWKRSWEEKKRRKHMWEVEWEEETWKRFEAAQERRQCLLADKLAEEARQAKQVQEEKAVRKGMMSSKHEKGKRNNKN